MTETNTHSDIPAPAFSELLRAREPAAPLSPALPGAIEQARAAFEVAIKWADAVLTVKHYDPPRSFFVGDGEDNDYVVPAELSGGCRNPLVEVDRDGQSCVRVPALGSAELSDGGPFEAADVRLIPLLPGRLVRVTLGKLCFEVRGVAGEKKLKSPLGLGRRGLGAIAMSAVAQIGLLLATAAFMPPLGSSEDFMVTEEQRYTMQHYLDSAAETERQAQDGQDASAGDSGSPEGVGEAEPGVRSPHDSPATALTRGSGGPVGPSPSVPVSSDDALRDAATFGMNEILLAHELGNVPSAWNTALSDIPSNFDSPATWSGDPLAPFGALSLSNPTGDGSNGPAGWYRVGELMPRQPGCKSYPCNPHGFDRLARLPRGGHQATSPSVRTSTPSTSGTIPASIIQRIVRANYGRFRACYEDGLRQNPSLEGRVQVNFIIGRDGTVRSANGSGSSLPDGKVTGCITGSFRGLTFPAPEHGTVTVTYPIMLSAPNA